MNEATARAIGAERKIADMTVRDLAAAAGIPERSLMRVLQAERDIKVNQVARIASALGIYPHELVETAEQILVRQQRGPIALAPVATDDSVDVSDGQDDDLLLVANNRDPHAEQEGRAHEW